MMKINHFPKEKSSIKLINDLSSAIVSYLKAAGQGVCSANLTEYKNLIGKFAKVRWGINLHYLKSKGISFRKVVTERFLRFDQPEKYESKAKNLSVPAIIEKITGIRELLDIRYSWELKN